MRHLVAFFAVVAPIAIAAASALAANPHFVGDPECVQSGETLTCSGKVAGLANETTEIVVSGTRVCTTKKGNNSPPGQVRGTSGPIPPSENGNITFSVPVSGGCPGSQTTSFGDTAFITVLQNGVVIIGPTAVPVTTE